jgi:hypothetical protein
MARLLEASDPYSNHVFVQPLDIGKIQDLKFDCKSVSSFESDWTSSVIQSETVQQEIAAQKLESPPEPAKYRQSERKDLNLQGHGGR